MARRNTQNSGFKTFSLYQNDVYELSDAPRKILGGYREPLHVLPLPRNQNLLRGV